MNFSGQINYEQFATTKSIAFVIIFSACTLIQVFSPHHKHIKSDFYNWRVNLSLGLLNMLFFALTFGVVLLKVSIASLQNGWGLMQAVKIPMILQILLTIVAFDLLTYGLHRLYHRSRFFWRFHQVHHSDVNFDTSTAVRFHLFELIISFCVRVAFVAALGIPPLAIIIFEVIYIFSNTFEHGNIALPRALEQKLEKVIITPALHRTHHSSRVEDFNSNYGTIFSFWDKIFNSHRAETSAYNPKIGLPGQTKDFTIVEALILPLKENN